MAVKMEGLSFRSLQFLVCVQKRLSEQEHHRISGNRVSPESGRRRYPPTTRPGSLFFADLEELQTKMRRFASDEF
jgi:hypothetical protein